MIDGIDGIYIIKIKIHSSCEIEYFVETHLCKLCVILRSYIYNTWHRRHGGNSQWPVKAETNAASSKQRFDLLNTFYLYQMRWFKLYRSTLGHGNKALQSTPLHIFGTPILPGVFATIRVSNALF